MQSTLADLFLTLWLSSNLSKTRTPNALSMLTNPNVIFGIPSTPFQLHTLNTLESSDAGLPAFDEGGRKLTEESANIFILISWGRIYAPMV